MKDNRGTEIEVGQFVCYNFMGQVALGKVEKITKGRSRSWQGYNNPEEVKHVFHIRRICPEREHYNSVSKVQHPENLMVIFEETND